MTSLPRSWLFVPGTRPDRFDKAAAGAAQGLILDLEDAVAETEKPQARRNVLDFLARPTYPERIVAVRINPLTCATGLEDLATLARSSDGPDHIMVPKAEDPESLILAASVLRNARSGAQLSALIESARGVARAAEIAERTPNLSALFFGAADYAADLGQQVGVFQPEFARAALVNAAAAGGVAAIDSPFFAIDRPDLLAAECAASRRAGFYGKAAIHPNQLAEINAAFQPTDAERALARRILDAAIDGVGVMDGKMIDAAMVRWAERTAP